MAEKENFLLNVSVLWRNMQKYFDHVLQPYDIGSGQIVFLTFINEHEGCTMQDVTNVCEVDKGTTTKSINRLIEQGYVQARQDEHDRRSKRLFTTKEATRVMNAIYKYRNECRSLLAQDIDFDTFSSMLENITDHARRNLGETNDLSDLKIGGLVKTTLLDYPGKVACTIFTSGCSFKCSYCHNRDLVYIPENYEFMDAEKIIAFLKKRLGILDGVCISGGEPLLQEKLIPFLQAIKYLGYKIKLDITGNHLDRLKKVVEMHLVDYIAMDIKNTKEKYAYTAGLAGSDFNADEIEECMEYVKHCGVQYEFRTTVVKELHTKQDLIEIAEWIKGCDVWYLQQFNNAGNLIRTGLHAYNAEEMEMLRQSVQGIVENVELRGVRI